jgi:hypothetical protein
MFMPFPLRYYPTMLRVGQYSSVSFLAAHAMRVKYCILCSEGPLTPVRQEELEPIACGAECNW